MQKILSSKDNYIELEEYFNNIDYKNILLVCTHSFYKSKLYKKLQEIEKNTNKKIVYFDRFEPNPKYESVCDGINEYKNNNCEFIMAVGGGSAIDVAKCIKLFNNMDSKENYLRQEIVPNDIELFVVPTTAGTGSEATHFAVIYYNDEKKSVADKSSIPNVVLFDSNFLKTLPLYQKKATILDAYSHSIESIWSINSTKESIEYATKSIELINENIDKYFENNEETFDKVLEAANLAGKAINITKTTAGHAMCYKLTSLYNIPHGQAAMLVNSELYPYMLENIDKCSDSRGIDYLKNVFENLANIIGDKSENYFRNLLSKYDLYNVEVNSNDIDLLVKSVNVERLSNNPIKLDSNDIKEIYTRLFNKIMEAKSESNRINQKTK